MFRECSDVERKNKKRRALLAAANSIDMIKDLAGFPMAFERSSSNGSGKNSPSARKGLLRSSTNNNLFGTRTEKSDKSKTSVKNLNSPTGSHGASKSARGNFHTSTTPRDAMDMIKESILRGAL